MKYLPSFTSAAACLLLSLSLAAQPGPGGPGGRGGRGGPLGPPLPPEQQALVDKFHAALAVENTAVTVASSNLVVATFGATLDKEKIAKANEELSKARQAWATKASRLFAEIQASDPKLSPEAINRLVQGFTGARGGRGMGPPGFGPGGPGPGGPPSAPGQ